MPLNSRSAYDEVNGYTAKSDADKARTYPQFFSKIRFNTFRHLNGLTFEFKHPITVISGSNRSGKTSRFKSFRVSGVTKVPLPECMHRAAPRAILIISYPS